MPKPAPSSLHDFMVVSGSQFSYRATEAAAFLRALVLPALRALGDQQSAMIIENSEHRVSGLNFDEDEGEYEDFQWLIIVPQDLFAIAAVEDEDGDGILEQRINDLGFPALDSVSEIRCQISPSIAAASSPVPYAAVCSNGHVLSSFVYDTLPPPFCQTCGGIVLTRCINLACGRNFPAVPKANKAITQYSTFCNQCGTAYPWRIKQMERVQRALNEQADIEDWNQAVRDRADELLSDIAQDNVDGPSVERGVEWMVQRGADGVRSIVWDAVKSAGSEALKAYARAHGFL